MLQFLARRVASMRIYYKHCFFFCCLCITRSSASGGGQQSRAHAKHLLRTHTKTHTTAPMFLVLIDVQIQFEFYITNTIFICLYI